MPYARQKKKRGEGDRSVESQPFLQGTASLLRSHSLEVRGTGSASYRTANRFNRWVPGLRANSQQRAAPTWAAHCGIGHANMLISAQMACVG